MKGKPSGKGRQRALSSAPATAKASAPGSADEAIADGARRHAKAALAALVEVMSDPEASPAARISAASAVLAWAFGRKGGVEAGAERPTELIIRWLKAGEGGRPRGSKS